MSTNLLSKKYISKNILPLFDLFLPKRKTKVPIWRIINAIFYRLKTGCQWRELPVSFFCRKIVISWNTVYYYFNKWSKIGLWEKVWIKMLSNNKAKLDLSSIQLDGSHTVAKNGGEAVKYQFRKRAKTSNALFLTDRNGQILAMSPPISGNHNDLFQIEKMSDKIFSTLEQANISLEGLFLNADAGFDSLNFRKYCAAKGIFANIDFNKRNRKDTDYEYFKDDLLYKDRFVVERFNAWLDAFRALKMRYERLNKNWITLHYFAFCILLLRKI